MICENSSTRANSIGLARCWANRATKRVTVIYNETDADELILCDGCAASVKLDAVRHGYTVKEAKFTER